MIKKYSYLVLLLFLLATFSCKQDVESYLFTRPTHPKNFRTAKDGELYAYTRTDTAISRADYFVQLKGYLMNYGEDKIIEYGHCWKEGANSIPDTSNSKLVYRHFNNIPPVGDSISFESTMLDLSENEEYSIASYVIVEREINGKKVNVVGYNPVVSKVKTRPGTNEWFEQYDGCYDPEGLNLKTDAGARFDAVGGSLNDTLLFIGTGCQGNDALLEDIIVYRNSQEGWVDETVIPFRLTQPRDLPNPGMMDGVAFAMTYRKENAEKFTNSIFVGFGDHGVKNGERKRSNFLLEYDLDTKQWHERSRNIMNRRSGAVCFVLGKYAYIGTGEGGASLEYNWFVFDPVEAAKGSVEGRPVGLRKISEPQNKIPRKGAVAFVLNGRGYFGLGTDGQGNFYKDFYEFTPTPGTKGEGSWKQIDDFPGAPRANAIAFTIGHFAYVGTGDNLIKEGTNSHNFMEEEGHWKGEIFKDFYRYNPYINKWRKKGEGEDIADYTSNQGKRENEDEQRVNAIRPITRAIGFSYGKEGVGIAGTGIIPAGYTGTIDKPTQQSVGLHAQKDFWKYQPIEKY